jgi:hypothetical protein
MLISLSACAPKPKNAQIVSTIQQALTAETTPPNLDFSTLTITSQKNNQTEVMVFTADKTIRRQYTLKYNNEAKDFQVFTFYTSQLTPDGKSYYYLPNDNQLALTVEAPLFPFTSDDNQFYLVQYVGSGNSIESLRTTYEAGLPTNNITFDFNVCDLGGPELILVVPRYVSSTICINELQHHSDVMSPGKQIGEYDDKPLYIFCSFDDKLPDYEIHVAYNRRTEYFVTFNAWLNKVKKG